jgi:valyl-tRNA synthetase/phosphoribosylanthranilate isomerase
MLPNGAYNHKEHEEEVLKRWLECGAYKPNKTNSESWTLICPPPNAYGRPHVGNISGYAYIDAMARIQRMKGKNVLVVPGKDHAGLEGEGVFVREVLEKQGRKKFDMKREDFYEEMMEFFKNNMQKARKDEQEIGLSADFDLDTFTLDPDIVDIVLDTFIDMYKQGMIYKGVRIVNWDPKARSAIADNQVVYEDAVTPFYYFKYSFGEPNLKALELKHQFQGKKIEWVFERNKTRDGKEDLPFTFGILSVGEKQIEKQNIESLQQDKIEIIGVGYGVSIITSPASNEGENPTANIEKENININPGDKLTGKVVGILMRMNGPHRLVVVKNPDINVGKEYILSLHDQIQKIFEFESKHYAGSHIILFDEYPEDKYYTNGFIIGTVRPETVFADTAIACSPDDERYKDFIGKSIEVEFLGEKKKLNFISDYSVLKEFGSGLLKVTPAHANEDWEIAQRHPKECLPAIQVIGYDLKMNSLAGKYADMKIKDARVAMEEDMIRQGNLIHVDREYKNKVAIAERTRAPIEPLLSSQWYLSYDKPINSEGMTLRQAALEMVNGKQLGVIGDELEDDSLEGLKNNNSGEIKILPSSMVGKFNNWMNNLRDWAISRSLWWGYRLPVWYHGELKEEIGGDGQVRELIKLKSDTNKTNYLSEQTILVDAVRVIISANENYDLESFSLNKELADCLTKLNARVIVVTNATSDGTLERINELLQDYNFEIFSLHKKPLRTEPEYFLTLAKDLNVNLSHTIYFDHKQENLDSAMKVGLKQTKLYNQDNTEIKRWVGKFFNEISKNIIVLLAEESGIILNNGRTSQTEPFTWDDEFRADSEFLREISKHKNNIHFITVFDRERLNRLRKILKRHEINIYSLHKDKNKTKAENFTTLIEELGVNIRNTKLFVNKFSSFFDNQEVTKDFNIETFNNKEELLSKILSDLEDDNISDSFSTHAASSDDNESKDIFEKVWTPLEYNNPNHIKVQKESPGEGWYQDESVLDTWFSSAQWTYATLMKYGLLQERYPTDVMVSGFDILENWDSRMMMFSYFKTGQIPFKNLYLTGLVKGTDGQKMSKSKGNIIDIDQVREKYGTDAVRMVYYYQNTAGADYAMTYEKLETFKRFANKIWNASKFVLMNIDDQTDTNVNNLQLEDLKLKENIDLFNFITQAKEHVTKNIDEYEFGLATYNLYQYFWHDFADIHIEAVKKYVLSQRDKTTNEVIQEPNAEEKAETTRVLLFTLKNFMKMLHPFMPFITQRIWNEVPKEEGENEFMMYSRW